MPKVEINRIWAMPNKWTFQIEPIKQMLKKYNVGNGWIDPFAGENSPAELTNDLNPDRPVKYHLHAKDFAEMLEDDKYIGLLFDPPYSLTQVKECYNSIGIDLMSQDDAKYFPTYIQDILARKIKLGGISISFGWNSTGLGRSRGFIPLEILLVPHGGNHNDTIVVVEKKIDGQLKLL